MDTPLTATAEPIGLRRHFSDTQAEAGDPTADAVSWGAITAGAAAAASLSLILLILGVGLGLSSVSPWARSGVAASTLGVSTILWLALTQLLASAMGGYLAGRLRLQRAEVHRDEVYFRDTAHGFLAWAIASLATAALLTSVIGSILGTGAQAGASLAGAATATAARVAPGADAGSTAYFVDTLFRRDAAAPPLPGAEAMERNTGRDAAEVGRIFTSVGRTEPLPAEDIGHVAGLVAQRTGLSPQQAEKRVTDTHARLQAKARDAEATARAAADKARKASAYSALWLFVSLLIGAFVASLAATFGGRHRDA